MFCQIVEATRLHDVGEQGKNVSNVIDELLHQFELIVKPQALEVCTQRIRTQNCNLELSHAHIHDEESCDNSLQDAANSLLGLINSLFGAI
jgi:hypothetical protein